MYSTLFNGWIGKLDEFWTDKNREKLFSSLFNYYQANLSPGQKIFIAFDHNESSKYIANQAANFFSKKGISVFISNRPLTSAMNQIIAKERYGCGSLSFVNDDFSFPYVGLKASNFSGEPLNDKEIVEFHEQTKQKKQTLEWYDPFLNLKYYLTSKFSFPEKNVAVNSIVWNSMYSPSSPLLEELFVDIFNKNSIDAYTINSYENTLPTERVNELEIQEQIELTSVMMRNYLCNFGITTTPDLSKIELAIDDKNKIISSSFENTLSKITPYLKSKSPIILANGTTISKNIFNESNLEIIKAPKGSFQKLIKENDFSMAVDEDFNVYLQNELFPNPFAALFCLYHSLIFAHSFKTTGLEKVVVK